jgi:hypothetical protein
MAHRPGEQQSPLASSAYAEASGSGFGPWAGSGVAPGPAGFAAPSVSTTAGVSGLPRARAVDGPLPPPPFTPAVSTAPSPPRVGKAPAILAGVAVVLALFASVGVGLKYRVHAKAAPATSAPVVAQPEPSSARPVESPPTAERAALAPSTSASASTASSADGGAAVPVIESFAKQRPGVPVAVAPVAVAPVAVAPAKRHDAPPPTSPVVNPPPEPSPPPPPAPPAAPAKPKPTNANPLEMKPITQ